MGSVLIRVGASLDRDAVNVYKPVVEAARLAAEQIGRIQVQAAKGAVVAQKQAARESNALEKVALSYAKDVQRQKAQAAKDAAKSAADAAKKSSREEADATKQAAREKLQAARETEKRKRDEIRETAKFQKEQARESERQYNAAQKVVASNQRAQQRATMQWHQMNEREQERVGRAPGAIPFAARMGRNALGFGARMARDIARGYGVETDLGSIVRSNANMETVATQVSNSGYMPGQAGANGYRVDPAELQAQARAIGDKTASDPTKVLEGLSKFTGKTGDLKTGRDMLGEMAILAKATGTSFDDMVDAAADVSNNIEDGADKGKRVAEIMKTIAGQGKLGAVEIKDFAVQMAKVGAAASRFGGDRAENFMFAGAMAQSARARGGASSATQAGTSVLAFTNQFAKAARLSGFKGLGVNVFEDEKTGRLRDMRSIVTDLIVKTGGNENKWSAAIYDAQAKRAVRGFSQTYTEAYAKAGGTEEEKSAEALKALTAEMDKFMNSAMSAGEQSASFAAAMKTGESKAQAFNNELGKVVAEIQTAALPALQMMGPIIVESLKTVSEWVAVITGKKAEDRQKADSGNAILGANTGAAERQLAAAIDSGEGLSNPDAYKAKVAFAKEQMADQEKAIETKKAEVAALQASRTSANPLGARATSEGVKVEQIKLIRMLAERDRLAEQLDRAMGGNALNVVIKRNEDRGGLGGTLPGGPTPVVNNGGRTGPDTTSANPFNKRNVNHSVVRRVNPFD